MQGSEKLEVFLAQSFDQWLQFGVGLLAFDQPSQSLCSDLVPVQGIGIVDIDYVIFL